MHFELDEKDVYNIRRAFARYYTDDVRTYNKLDMGKTKQSLEKQAGII
jgi:hypothetical protein